MRIPKIPERQKRAQKREVQAGLENHVLGTHLSAETIARLAATLLAGLVLRRLSVVAVLIAKSHALDRRHIHYLCLLQMMRLG
jgi:hypothetical protein